MATLQFLGAAGTVTGSMFLLTTRRARVLVDCGLFQGPRELKARNRKRVETPGLDAVVLTHAHLDHTGYLPKLVADGFAKHAYCTPATADLLGLLLPDSGHIQEEEARHANRKGWSRHRPAVALYTMAEARRALDVLRPLDFGLAREVAAGIRVTFHAAGHILGSAIAEIAVEDGNERFTIVFSGDLGRTGMPLLCDPVQLPRADFVVVESTYGDRLHPATPPADELARVINEAAARGGMLILPAFAVGRTQELLYALRELEDAGAIPTLDVFVDSPMAIEATALTLGHKEEFDAQTTELLVEGIRPLAPRKLHIVPDAAHSRAINAIRGPGIILSASGMCTGGRIKHHLRVRLPDPRNTVCFVGFQAAGTRGRAIADGAQQVWIFGEQVPVKATIARVEGFSAHADRAQLLAWLAGFQVPPQAVFVVHGEPKGSEALAQGIMQQLGWRTHIPVLDEIVSLTAGGAGAKERMVPSAEHAKSGLADAL